MAANAGPAGASIPQSIDATLELLRSADYVADRSLATVLFLSLRLGRPLFLEGEAGVGKTEIAKVLSQTLGRRLIRLQCYEGLDAAAAVYEWNYAQQMMAIRLAEAAGDHDRAQIVLADDWTELFVLHDRYARAATPGEALSLVALTPDVTLDTEGLRWPLHGPFEMGTRGLSNEAVAEEIVVDVHSGLVAVITPAAR